MLILIWTILSILVVSSVSLVGIITFAISEKRLQSLLTLMVSFSTGALLGDVFIHLLPEAVENSGFNISVSFAVLAGVLLSFIIEKIIHWRHCHIPLTKDHAHPFALMNLYGDGVHNFIDGLIIGGSYLVNIPLGIATTLAVIFHEIPQEMGDFGVLLRGGFSKRRALYMNFLTALTAVAGGIIAVLLGNYLGDLKFLLVPFAAGNFVYIAGADLIPELHKELLFKNSVKQLIALIAGIGVMYLLLLVE